jgi:hypothetical protein
MNWRVSRALWRGARPQIQVPSDKGELRSWQRTPNTFRAHVLLHAATQLSFNQNFARGFVSDHGTLTETNGLLALDLPAGEHELTVRYRPAELAPSAAVSCMGVLILLLLLRLRRNTNGAT